MLFDVLVTQEANERYTARVLSLPDIVVSGTDEREVLEQVQKALDRWRMGKAHGRLYETDDDCTLTYCYWHRGEKRRRRQDEALLLECGKLVHKIPRAPDSSE